MFHKSSFSYYCIETEREEYYRRRSLVKDRYVLLLSVQSPFLTQFPQELS